MSAEEKRHAANTMSDSRMPDVPEVRKKENAPLYVYWRGNTSPGRRAGHATRGGSSTHGRGQGSLPLYLSPPWQQENGED